MDLLPPELRSYDGHPHALLAAAVCADLAKVGVPVYLVDDSDDHSHVAGGLVLRLGVEGMGVFLSWYVPEEDRLAKAHDSEAATVFGAAAALTTTIVGILAGFGYRVKPEFDNPDFPYPFVYVLPQPSE
ncbi:hypothetical protein ACIPSA_35480 [Streptomyces sp. NPDC086549]|uniref:hypothetical protein n=1 Tax=Streptomyces sp. NPDC086549 TaxID=3365752 RepID=UPI0037FA8FD9